MNQEDRLKIMHYIFKFYHHIGIDFLRQCFDISVDQAIEDMRLFNDQLDKNQDPELAKKIEQFKHKYLFF